MLKLRKGDIVQVIKGRDKGKKGKIITLFCEERRALVEGVNLVKKHKRQTRQDQQGGIVSVERPLSISNIMYLCKSCAKPSRLGFKLQENKVKSRFCKRCKETV